MTYQEQIDRQLLYLGNAENITLIATPGFYHTLTCELAEIKEARDV